MNSQYLDRLINSHFDDALTAAEHAELETSLRESEAVRRRFWKLAEVHGLAGDAARTAWPAADEGLERHPLGTSVERSQATTLINHRLNRILVSPLGATVLGLILGILSTAAIWAATATASGRRELVSLFHDSFESGPNPVANGSPLGLDAWGGDHAEIVEAWPAIQPANGKRMLRFLRADYLGKKFPTGYVGDVYRIVALESYKSELAGGDSLASVEAAFGSLPFEESRRFYANLSLNALDKLPSDEEAWRAVIGTPTRLETVSLASASRRRELSPDHRWQRLSVEMRLPPETRYLLVGLHVADLQAARDRGSAPPAVEFEGQFADDIRLTLRRASDRH